MLKKAFRKDRIERLPLRGGRGKVLSPKDEMFCQYYCKSGISFGNARRSYALAFSKECQTEKQKKVCDVLSLRLLGKVIVHTRCQVLLNEKISDDVLDKELAKVIQQDENLHAKVSAISEANKVRGRITEKHRHQFEGISDEALAEAIAERIAGAVGNDGGTGNKE